MDDGWEDGWKEAKAGLRIAYSNHKDQKWSNLSGKRLKSRLIIQFCHQVLNQTNIDVQNLGGLESEPSIIGFVSPNGPSLMFFRQNERIEKCRIFVA